MKNKTKTTRTSKLGSTATPTQTSVANGIKVITTAIKKKISLSEASRTHNFGRNYVSDVRTRITDNYKRKSITKDTYNTFNSLIKKYEAIA